MADFNFNPELLSSKEVQNLSKQLNNIDELAKKQSQYSKLSEEEYKKRVEEAKKQLELEAKINSIKEKSINQVKDSLKSKEKELLLSEKQKQVELSLTNNETDRKKLEQEIRDIKAQTIEYQNRQKKIQDSEVLTYNKILNLQRAYKDVLKNITSEKKEQAKVAKDTYEEYLKRQAAGENISEDRIKEAKRKAEQSATKAEASEQIASIVDNGIKKITSGLNSIASKIGTAIDMYSSRKGVIDARLQTLTSDTAKTFDSINAVFQGSVQTSGYLSFPNLIQNIDKLTAAGVSYNVEERAFLETISNKMVASFNALDSSLTRMIRIQQADMTRMMLGNEATLTQLFNEFFEDTSYLATGVSDTIASNILDAGATMNAENSSAFQFAVQKWLGALYEVGASNSTVSSIAQAINLLGTGQASAFSSSSVATLLNMAIARSDYSLSDVLSQGLNVEFVDSMMSSMITLLSDIKENTSSQVTLSAYADVFGVSMSDLRSFTNLKKDLASLTAYNQTAAESKQAVDNQLNLLSSRTTVAEKINNIIENYSYIIGENIADNTTQYVTYKIGDLVRQLGAGTIVGIVGAASQIGSAATALGEYTNVSFGGGTKDWKILDTLGLGWIQDIVNFAGNVKNFLISGFGSFNTNNLLNASFSALPFVRYERGAEYAGVMPDYGAVTASTSASYGLSMPGIRPNAVGSSESAYGLVPVSEGAGGSVQEKIASLNDVVATTVQEYISTETAAELEKSVTLQDVYTEVFLNQDYPIKVHISHFDERAMSQLKGDAHMDDDSSYLKALYNYAISNGIPVEIGSSDVSTLMRGMYNVRGSY